MVLGHVFLSYLEYFVSLALAVELFTGDKPSVMWHDEKKITGCSLYFLLFYRSKLESGYGGYVITVSQYYFFVVFLLFKLMGSELTGMQSDGGKSFSHFLCLHRCFWKFGRNVSPMKSWWGLLAR